MSKKVLFSVEYPVRSSPSILFNFLSTPAGLQEWFADEVDESEGVFTFGWNGTKEKAKVLDAIEDKLIRFQWEGSPAGEYFEFLIDKSEITNLTMLVIKDFAEKKDIKDQSQLWEHQVKDLFHRIGA